MLADHTADEAVRRIDYDFSKLGVNESLAMAVVLRAKPIDTWAAAFLKAHPDAVVLHLGCGMDSRPFRLAPPPTVTWYDVDQAEVIALRERVYDPRPGYHLISTDVTDLGWLDEVPDDRPTLVVAEGLTMYLTEQGGTELLKAMIAKFPAVR